MINRALLFVLLVFTFMVNGFTQIVKDDFQHPPSHFYPMPFWHMNGELTNEGIIQQMTDASKVGFKGLAILPVHNTLPEFLSDDYFKKYVLILETAKKLNMEIILYDDTGFPSGTAGGRIERDFPQHVRKSIEKTEMKVRGYWKVFVPEGKLMAAVAMNMETKERVDLSPFIENDLLSWKVPKGDDWRVMFFNVRPATFWKSHMPVDYLDTAAVNQFIKLTYYEYANRLGDYFQNTIKMSFFDDVGFLLRERTWTEAFNEKFVELNGFEPTLYYPALWYDIGPETEAARVAFFDTCSELLAEGYMKMVTRWTKKYGLKNTGHPPGNYGIQPVDMNGDIFKYYRYTDIPLTDLIINYGYGRDGFKMISSAADYYDRPVTSTEIYGALKENIVDSLMLYRALMEIQARGVNFVIPHGMWYNPEKVGIAPLISPFSEKLAPALPVYSDYVARSCYMLQGGRRVADIALLYPIASLQGGYFFDSPDNTRAGKWTYPEADYLKISDMLTNEIQRDFTFVHPEFLATDKYEIQNDILHLNNIENHQDYKLLIIPAGKIISLPALQKIKQFYDKGGKVIATSLLPGKSAEMGKDDEVIQIIQEMFGESLVPGAKFQANEKGGKAVFIPNPTIVELSKAIADLLPNSDVAFSENPEIKSELGLFSCIHKVRDGKDIYFFANSSDNEIDTDVLIRGKKKLESWNPHNGTTLKLSGLSYVKMNGQTYTKCKLKLRPVSSLFWVSN